MSNRLPISTVKAYFIQAIHEGVQCHVLQFNNLLSMLQYRKAYEITLQYLSSGIQALDWGCGNGHFSYFLNLHNINTTGYSFESFPVFLKQKELFRFVQGIPGKPTELPFGDSSFDMVFSVGVLEHVRDSGGTETGSLSEIRRILKPEGLFISFHFPNKYQWVEYVGRLTGLAGHFHNWKYTCRDIRRLAKEGGFKIEKTGRYNFLPRNQLSHLPDRLTRNNIFIYTYEFIDRILSKIFPVFCTNFYFVMRADK